MGFEGFPFAVHDHSATSAKLWKQGSELDRALAGLEYERRNDLNAEVFAELLPIVGCHEPTLKSLMSAFHPLHRGARLVIVRR